MTKSVHYRGPVGAGTMAVLLFALVGCTTSAHHSTGSNTAPPSSGGRASLSTELSGSATANVVRLHDSTFPLPPGWTAAAVPLASSAYRGVELWCLRHTTEEPRAPLSSCDVVVERVDGANANTDILDVRETVAVVGAPCQYSGAVLTDASKSTFGGRAADFRRFRFSCLTPVPRLTVRPAEYIVATDPGFIIYSPNPDADLVALMRTVAHSATLPAQDLPLRLSDIGIVRTATRNPDQSWTVTIERVIWDGAGGYAIPDTSTYTYRIPKVAWTSVTYVGPPVEQVIRLNSNGQRVLNAIEVTSQPQPRCPTAAQALAIAKPNATKLALDSAHGYDCLYGWAYVNYHAIPHGNHSTAMLHFANRKWTGPVSRLVPCGDADHPPAVPTRIYQYGCGN